MTESPRPPATTSHTPSPSTSPASRTDQLTATPFLGGTLYTGTRSFRAPHVAGGAAGVPGAGFADIALSVPTDPTLAGATFYAQSLYLDAGGPTVASATGGLSITLLQ